MAEPTSKSTSTRFPSQAAPSALTTRIEREIEATLDRGQKAQLLYELGELLESGGNDEARAVKSYVASVNADPTFRPPLWNLLRVFTARKSFKNLAKILDAEVKASPAGTERAAALTARAELAEDRLGDVAAATSAFERARAEDRTYQPALMALERLYSAARDTGKLASVYADLVAGVKSPARQALLLADLAELTEGLASADVGRTTEAWCNVIEAKAFRFRLLRAAERFFARADRPEELALVLEKQAEVAAAVATGEPASDSDPLPFEGPAEARRAAAALWRRAARLREQPCKDAAAALALLDKAQSLEPEDALIREDRLRLSEKLGDAARIDQCVKEVLAGAPADRTLALLRAAESCRRRNDTEGERTHLLSALAGSPHCAVSAALLEAHLLAQKDSEGLVNRFLMQAGAASSSRERAAHHLAAIDAAVGCGHDLKLADALCGKALEALGPEPTVMRLRAVLQARQQSWATLCSTYQDLLAAPIEIAEKLCVARELAFVRAFRMRDLPSGIDACDRALALDPRCRWALWMKSDLCAEAGLNDLRAGAHEALAELAVGSDEAVGQWVAAAHAWSLAGEHERSLALLRRALERQPSDPIIESLLEERLRALGQWAELVAHKRVLRADRSEEQRIRELGRAAVLAEQRLRDPETVADIYQQVIDATPEDEGAWFGLLRCLHAMGDKQRLLGALEARAQALSGPAEPAALLELGEWSEALGRGPLAQEAYRRALDAGVADALPGLVASVGSSGELGELQKLMARARVDASTPLQRAIDEQLLVLAVSGTPLEGLPPGELADRVHAADPQEPLALLVRSWNAGAVGDISARLVALGDFVASAADGALASTALSVLARAARAALSDDVLQRAARGLCSAEPQSRSLAITVADGLPATLDDSLRARGLSARRDLVGPDQRAHVEVLRAEALERASRDVEALVAFQAALRFEPEDLGALEGARRTARRIGDYSTLRDASLRQAKLVATPLAAAPMWEEAGLILEEQMGDRESAESCYRAALAADPTRANAHARLHAILSARGARRELSEYVHRRAEVATDPAELSDLFFELGALRKELGDPEGALGALENLLLLAEDHVDALAMRAALLVELRHFSDAVEAFGILSDALGDVDRKRAARFDGAEIALRSLHAPDAACSELWALDAGGYANLETYERIATIAAQANLSQHLLKASEKLAQLRIEPNGRAAAERTVSKIQRSAGNVQQAVQATARLLSLLPDDLAALEALCEMGTEPETRMRALEAAEQALHERLDSAPLDVDALHAIARVYSLAGQRDARFLVGSVLWALGEAMEAEAHDAALLSEMLPRMPSASLSQASLHSLVHPSDRGPARDLLLTIAEALPAHYGLEPAAFVPKNSRISPKGVSVLRDGVATWSGALSLGAIELYQGGPEPSGVIPLPAAPPVLILGSELKPSLSSAQLFHLGRAVMRLSSGTAALHGRSADEIGALLYAAVRVTSPQAAAPPLLRLAELTGSLPASLSRKVRRLLPEPASAFLRAPAYAEWVQAERHTANRAGALFARDPAAALGALLETGEGNPGLAAVRASAEAIELVRFVLSRSFLALRREARLGIA